MFFLDSATDNSLFNLITHDKNITMEMHIYANVDLLVFDRL